MVVFPTPPFFIVTAIVLVFAIKVPCKLSVCLLTVLSICHYAYKIIKMEKFARNVSSYMEKVTCKEKVVV
ncbi:hypothetical protein AGMMS49921_06810 [Endomicrobiia bacterium]|nr:hypothetical protein AGMMS49921_06810 [Endomicrobiia bacterium]